ncbi:MAG TPA: hypothetical protein VH681_10590 [Nitrospiraceae bacterium]|jgi:hypothetical protein
MQELLLVLACVAGLVGVGLVAIAITPQIMIVMGLWTLAGGLLLGIPTGFWYHVALYRKLAPRMPLPPRWWRRPVELHARLTALEFSLIRPWFIAGAVGFVLCCVGGVAAIIGLLVTRLQEG